CSRRGYYSFDYW
nr:immunoglobulin heavy chain junction region [Mus musculus]